MEEKLLDDLGSQAGLVLRNVCLTAELQARLREISQQATELRASRQRIVAAQDEERRRLERNIHDGAQQHLVALAVKLRLAATLIRRKPEEAGPALAGLEASTADALDTLNDLSRGIYPSPLRDQGLVPALHAQAEKMTVPVDIQSDGLPRFSPEVETAAYFACLEALQNVAKHARASAARVRLTAEDGELRFMVSDDGVGFDPGRAPTGSGLQNMADRLQALGGRLDIRTAPGSGTTVTGRVPALVLQAIA